MTKTDSTGTETQWTATMASEDYVVPEDDFVRDQPTELDPPRPTMTDDEVIQAVRDEASKEGRKVGIRGRALAVVGSRARAAGCTCDPTFDMWPCGHFRVEHSDSECPLRQKEIAVRELREQGGPAAKLADWIERGVLTVDGTRIVDANGEVMAEWFPKNF